jgi:hypothetical protein
MLSFLLKRLGEAGPDALLTGRLVRRCAGPDLRRLLNRRILVEQTKVDVWSVCHHCDCGLDGRPIREIEGKSVACCPHDPGADEVLEPEDRERFAIRPAALVHAVAAASGLAEPKEVMPGIWRLGALPSGRLVLLAINRKPLEPPGAILSIQSAISGATAAIILPQIEVADQLRLREAGLHPVLMSDCILDNSAGCGVIDAQRLEPSDAIPRLFADLARQTVRLDGRHLDLPPQMFALFRILVEQARTRDPLVRKQEIEARTGRPANEIIRDLRRSLVACGLGPDAAEALIVTVRPRGYRLGLSASEISIEG